jgi:hypothetical protein
MITEAYRAGTRVRLGRTLRLISTDDRIQPIAQGKSRTVPTSAPTEMLRKLNPTSGFVNLYVLMYTVGIDSKKV